MRATGWRARATVRHSAALHWCRLIGRRSTARRRRRARLPRWRRLRRGAIRRWCIPSVGRTSCAWRCTPLLAWRASAAWRASTARRASAPRLAWIPSFLAATEALAWRRTREHGKSRRSAVPSAGAARRCARHGHEAQDATRPPHASQAIA